MEIHISQVILFIIIDINKSHTDLSAWMMKHCRNVLFRLYVAYIIYSAYMVDIVTSVTYGFPPYHGGAVSSGDMWGLCGDYLGISVIGQSGGDGWGPLMMMEK